MTLVGPFEATVEKYDGKPIELQLCTCHPKDKFRVAMNVGSMPLLEFAHAANSGLDTSEMEGLAALYSMLQDCIEPADWNKFRTAVKAHKSTQADLLKVATSIWAALSNRPLESASSSENGQPNQDTGSSSNEPVSDSSLTFTEPESKKPASVRPRRKTAGSTSSV